MAFTDDVDTRMAHAPSSAAKTALNTDIDTLGAELATQFTGTQQTAMEDLLLDLASTIADELVDA